MKISSFCILSVFVSTALFAVEIPHSVKRLNEIKDKDSEEYTFLSHQAAMDARLGAMSALEGKNSSGALKILGVALEGMPHRTDLKDLRNKALSTFISITKKLEEDVIKNCELLKERYSFIKSYAPDAMGELTFDQRCVKTETVTSFKVPEPKYLKKLENEFKADLTHSTRDFPYEDVLNNIFMLFTSLYGEDFKVTCQDFKIEGEKVKGTCSSTPKKESTYKEVSLKYCKFLTELLSVTGGGKPVLCTIDGLNQVFQTSDAIYQVYVAAVDNSSFDEDIPLFHSMKMNIVRADGTTTVPVVVSMDQKSFKHNKFPEATLMKAHDPYYFEKLGPETTFEVNPGDLKGLKEITFTLNLKHTYETYKTHYEKAIKSDLACKETSRMLSTMEASRQRKKLEDSFKKNCAEKGNLKQLLLDTL